MQCDYEYFSCSNEAIGFAPQRQVMQTLGGIGGVFS